MNIIYKINPKPENQSAIPFFVHFSRESYITRKTAKQDPPNEKMEGNS